ncbi:MAG: response regulator [Fimbriimonadaceae bacterium]|nr:response regulator [Fimbriimonadaceae bacterium]
MDLANLRHELRTPLTVILGYSEMVLEELRERHDVLADDVVRVRDAGYRLLAMIEELLGGEAARKEDGSRGPATERLRVPQSSERAPSETGRLLAVDDLAENRDLLARHLVRQGHEVVTAEDGLEALELAAGGDFDAILLDVMMPNLDGYGTLERLKADPATRDTPVLMVSALDELASVVRCIEAGAEDYLPKPFNPVLLRARLDAALRKKRARDRELDYLQAVAQIAEAAGAVERGAFQLGSLDRVKGRDDALGGLARVFAQMADEVRAREESLRRQVRELRVEIDAGKKAKDVAEITETDYFRNLQERAAEFRSRRGEG